MALDRLAELGKVLDKTRGSIGSTTRDTAQNFPVIEKSLDLLGSLYTYRLEFKTYSNNSTVYLDLYFLPRFRAL